MPYSKQNFVDGQTLTADHLNHIEDGLKNLDTVITAGNIPVDTTLTQERKAADAKATGDAISAIPRVEVGDTQPTDEGVELWVDTTQGMSTFNLPEINDEEVSTMDTWSSKKITEMIFEMTYPVGKILYTTRAEDPSTYLGGGTWQQIKDKFLLGAGDTYEAGSEGGEAKHILTIEEMPSHTHGLYSRAAYAGGGTYIAHCNANNASEDYNYVTDSKGGGEAHNNMPPYKTVYIWERIS